MNLHDYARQAEHLAGLTWIRWFHHDALSDLRLRRLPEDARGAYPYVLSLAAASDIAPGALVDDEGHPLDPDQIARDTGLSEKTVRRFCAIALRRGILAQLDDGHLYFPAYLERQISAEDHAKREAFRATQSEKGKRSGERRREKAEARRARVGASSDATPAPAAAPTPAPTTERTEARTAERTGVQPSQREERRERRSRPERPPARTHEADPARDLLHRIEAIRPKLTIGQRNDTMQAAVEHGADVIHAHLDQAIADAAAKPGLTVVAAFWPGIRDRDLDRAAAAAHAARDQRAAVAADLADLQRRKQAAGIT